MRVVETSVEAAGRGKYRVTTILEDDGPHLEESREGTSAKIGEGPTGGAIPDRIVQTLIEHLPGGMPIAEIQREVGGNPGTVNRQAWTLATNAPDLQIRLRGWVISPDRGWYALSSAALEHLTNT